MEGALGDLGEDADHGVEPLLVVQHGEGENLEAVGGELSPQEPVYQEDLETHVDQVHDLAEDKPVSRTLEGHVGQDETLFHRGHVSACCSRSTLRWPRCASS